MPTIEEVHEKELLFQQKNNHQRESIESLKIINWFLTVVYYISILVVFYVIYSKYNFSLKTNIGILVLLLLYPFIAYLIESNLYEFGTYLWSFVTGDAYIPMKKYSYRYN
jgi:multisubunit Na+/H+ antiporter MnhG subunit